MQYKKSLRYCLLTIPWLCILSMLFPMVAYADLPYYTNYRNTENDLVWTQAAYAPSTALGKDILLPDSKDPDKKTISPMMQPRDLFIDDKDWIYVSDTGNNRIVVFNPQGEFSKVITVDESPLSSPQGIYVNGQGQIYIADTGNRRIVLIDNNGKLLKEIAKPESRFIPESYRFEPVKIAVDKRGFLYIVSLGSYHGLMQLDPDGQFQRFFGANAAPFSVMDSVKRLLFTREMFERQIRKLPPAINNISIDRQGFIYTVSYGEQMTSQQVKKLTFAGQNFLGSRSEYASGNNSFGERRFGGLMEQKPNLVDIAVDDSGNFTVIDSNLKYISQYDAFGNLLFFWAGFDNPMITQLGVAKSPSAIDVNSRKELYLLDSHSNLIQVFRLTEFGALVHKANGLTVEGKYDEARPYWREILHLNAYYTPAPLGLAQAAYREGNYEEAQKLFAEAGSQEGYSNSFWQIRLKWFQEQFSLFMNLLIIVSIGYFIFEKVAKKYGFQYKSKFRLNIKNQLWLQLRHSFYLMRHPIDGFVALRYENKGSYLSAFILLVSAFLALCISKTVTSYSFNPAANQYFDVTYLFYQFMLVWLVWVVSNYLVSSIMRGEGRFKDVFMGSAYALLPLIIIGIPLALLSNGMTQNEAAIFDFLNNGMTLWMMLLIFWKVQSIQNYSVGETLLNIFFTMLTMILFGVLFFVFFGLFVDLKDFIYSIIQEVSVR